MTQQEVFAFGDWHGNKPAALSYLRAILDKHPDARLIHVGDFGFWETDILTNEYKKKLNNYYENDKQGEFPELNHTEDLRGYVYKVNQLLEEYNQDLYVCLGNHENYWEIDFTYGYHGFCVHSPIVYDSVEPGNTFDMHIKKGIYPNEMRLYCTGMDITDDEATYDEDGFITSKLFPRVKIIPRAHVWTWDDVTYASLGGANSIDIAFRTRGKTWWEQEAIHPEETEWLIDLCKDKNIDVFITHDAPEEVSYILYGHGAKLPDDIRAWGNRSGKELQKATCAMNPTLQVCGHHHMRKTFFMSNGTTVEILDRENTKIHENSMNITKRLAELQE